MNMDLFRTEPTPELSYIDSSTTPLLTQTWPAACCRLTALYKRGFLGDGFGGSNVQEPKSWDELYTLDLMPSELFLKFRKEIQGFRVAVNMEFYNAPSNEFESKLVLKPLANDRRWKFMYAPLHHDVSLMSKKIPVTNFLNLQVGVGHSFGLNSTGLNWKLSTCLGGDGLSRIRNKTSLGLCPGVDLRFAWKADYVLPEFNGAVGTGKPLFNMNSGSLHASLDRVELILTHTTEYVPYNQVPEGDTRQPPVCLDT